jgi:hypothetical protein
MSANDVLDGGSIVAAAAIALFFLRFNRATGDRLFAFFAVAFVIFAIDRLLLVILPGDTEALTVVYLVRAAGFVAIVVAVIDKNRRPHRSSRPPEVTPASRTGAASR